MLRGTLAPEFVKPSAYCRHGSGGRPKDCRLTPGTRAKTEKPPRAPVDGSATKTTPTLVELRPPVRVGPVPLGEGLPNGPLVLGLFRLGSETLFNL